MATFPLALRRIRVARSLPRSSPVLVRALLADLGADVIKSRIRAAGDESDTWRPQDGEPAGISS